MLIGTAGHIDHGKTSLIKRLTGRDTDRLPEEIKRGISIELGYAYVPAGDEVLGFVDVPGHERLVHTMLAGATGIDFALMVIAADDGVMPQTDEHLDILLLLGIEAGAVALTKVDAVPTERIDEVRRQIEERVRNTPAAGWPVFAVSSLNGDGVDVLQRHLLQQAAAAPQQTPAVTQANGHFRMAIDRCFTLAGVGTVVTGTAHAGSIRVGEIASIGPTAHGVLSARVRSIHAQDRVSDSGLVGQRCALNLAGIEKGQVERGMWVQAPALANIADRFDATLRLSPRVAKALANSSTVHLHLGTADVMARIAVLDATRIEAGESRLVAVALDRPVAACRGDRFVIRDASAQRTLGGGTVLDVVPLGSAPKRGRRAPARLQLLTALRDRAPVDALLACLDREPVRLARLASAWNLRDDEVNALIITSGAHVAAGVALSSAHWQRLRDDAIAAIGLAHQREPEMPGVEQQKLRRSIAPALDNDVFGLIIDELLSQSSLQRRGAFLALPTHTAELRKDQRVRWERIKPLLAERKFEPPRVRDIARDTGIVEIEVRNLLKTVARTGDVTLVAPDHFFLTTAVAELADIAGSVAERHGAARAAEFRDQIATGRKLAIQILEFFDKVGYLHRVRDDHLVRRANPWRA
ncbi:MAG: selenocysteine-specific translation elongation factor [Burkholderiaceae bacterium]|nr:selenocysteine-specific translation elongation factor [Burkholderiaceae bacterium]